VTRRSGKTSVVVRRYACNKRLANALYHWARLATQHDALSRRRYAALRQRGHSHGRALRTSSPERRRDDEPSPAAGEELTNRLLGMLAVPGLTPAMME
jgi:hypothetical protein